jgi:hypothetical protein
MHKSWVLLLVCFANLSAAQQRNHGMLMIWPLSNGLFVAVNTVCEPAHVAATPFSCFSGDNIEGRIQFDPSGHILSGRETKTWVGYSFDAEKTGSGDTIRFTMSAAKGPGAEGMTQLPLPKFNGGPVVVAPGDVIRIPLLVNPNTGQTLIDEVQLFTHEVSGEDVLGPAGEAHDLTFQDVQMKWMNGIGSVNGKQVQTVSGGSTGTVVWYSFEELGTAVLSFFPQSAAGFEKAGQIQGKTLQFQIGSNNYEWNCSEPILPGDGVYNLYVHWDSRVVTSGAWSSTKSAEAALQAISQLMIDQQSQN